MIRTYLIVDDFQDNPMELREIAKNLDFPDPDGKADYPGRNASRRIKIEGLERIGSIKAFFHEGNGYQ